MAKLILTDSYFNLFDILTKELKNSANTLSGKNLVFCEEKVSLMAERKICADLKGSFNTDVFSFGNYLRAKKRIDKLLSREGSAMAVRRILKNVNLKCFKINKANLAPVLFELIIQLKSAKITPSDILLASEKASGILKNKLQDVYAVFNEYEQFISNGGFDDQSSMLSYLPQLLENSNEIKSANVYILGFSGWTSQTRNAILSLLKTANSVTAILTGGANEMLYVGETEKAFTELCKKAGVPLDKVKVDGGMTEEGRTVVNTLFNPLGFSPVMRSSDKVYYQAFKDVNEEINRIAQIIKNNVVNSNCRYRDFTIALPDITTYRSSIKSIFSLLKIPYFLDEQRTVENHPLVTLITAYSHVFKRNFERGAVLAFIKNPLFSADKIVADAYENYLLKYNINYNKIKEPYTFEEVDGVGIEKLQDIRAKLVSVAEKFNVRNMLNVLGVKDRLDQLSNSLKEIGESEENAVNEQIYDSVQKILDEMDMMLGQSELSVNEYVSVFMSGVQALKLSIIPQYTDAVFIGDYKQTALAKTDCLFAVGLTSDVPNVKADVALLSDGDIEQLENIKVLVEPKIRIVNHRNRENLGLALGAFESRLYLSYPTSSFDGKKNVKSEVLSCLCNLFETKSFGEYDGYITKEQGMQTFAKEIGEFAEGRTCDIDDAVSYYFAVEKDELKPLLDRANKEVKKKLDGRSALIGGETAPTVIEDYFKCPYRAFLSHVIKLRDREDGQVNALSVGNFMHDILRLYIKDIATVHDRQSSDELYEKVKEKVLDNTVYAKFYQDKATAITMDRVISECREYCYKTFLYYSKSDFKAFETEVSFGDGEKCKYPSIPLLKGKVKLTGKIDRVDKSKKYFRVVDYKTGGTDTTDQSLFAGLKLQLYLYAAAVKGAREQKDVAGLYYLPISDAYEKQDGKDTFLAKGKTLKEDDALMAQDNEFFTNGKSDFIPAKISARGGKLTACTEKEILDSYIDYALAISEKAVKRMEEGYVIPSPYQSVCDYCKYGALCGKSELSRTVGSVNEITISQAVKGENENVD